MEPEVMAAAAAAEAMAAAEAEAAMAEARQWLAEEGVVETADGRWLDAAHPDDPRTGQDLAQLRGYEVFVHDHLDIEGMTRLAFGLLDLLDEYWVTCEIRFAHAGPDGPLPAGPLWDGYRRRLEAQRDAEPVEYSLWVDWFEDRTTTETAFAEVLANDITAIVTAPTPATLRRAARVLSCSGPVPWATKHATYETAARLPALHPALFKALLTSYHDLYGSLDPAAALSLLTRLDLPPDTEHLRPLHTVLTAGHVNHYRSRDAWAEAKRAGQDQA